ncbi:MAG TPA: hypothetical protein VFX59_19265 [Polyangiales bacterium]|nr:hypothetical protein [Polyangiales bacterium]
MKLRELDKQVAAHVQRLLPGALLLIGATSSLLGAVTTLETPTDGHAAQHDAALWLAPGDALVVRAGIAALRGKLKPGSPIMLAVRRRPPVLQQVRGLLGGPAPHPIELEALCGALLASGLVLPRVHAGPRAFHLLAGSLPTDPSPLDAFFTQPPAS